MENDAESLMPLYRAARARGDTLVLATLVQTAGSTYRKSGTQMLIAADGQYAGLLSGGCLEGDLAARAREVIATGRAVYVSYDMRGADDPLWGLGSGCEGAMRILLSAVGPNSGWAPLVWLEASLTADSDSRYGLVVAEHSPELGHCLPVDVRTDVPEDVEAILWITLTPPPTLLLCGAGPDAVPVAQFARLLGWRVVAADHRSAYLKPERFSEGVRLIDIRPAALRAPLPGNPDAAVIMSHHLETDRGWLAALAANPPAFVGLLGPAPRREKLLGELSGAQRETLAPVLRAPVGLDLGGRSPAAIALAIVSEIQAALHLRAGQPFSTR